MDTGQETTHIYGPSGRIAKKVGELTDYYHTDHLRSTRLITDESGNTVTEVSYTPFGESTLSGEEDSYLFTGKEKGSSGLYYYGMRYYDPETGRFMTRDQNLGRTNSPATLNRYTYCANNPLKYIDPDGRDYFIPEWSEHPGGDSNLSLRGSLQAFQLWFQKGVMKLMASYGQWARNNSDTNTYLQILAGGTFSAVAGGPLGIIGGVALGVVFFHLNDSAELYYDLWNNDSYFVGLYTTAEMYVNLLLMGCDCEQEATDACVELAVYILQQKWGSSWRSHAPTSLPTYYDEMMERKQKQSTDNGTSSSSTSSGSGSGSGHTPPPGTQII